MLGKCSIDGFDYSTITVEAEYCTNFSEQEKKLFLGLHRNGSNRYLFVSNVKIYQFKAKESELVGYPLCLDNISDTCMIFELIMIVLMLMIF